MMPTREQIIEKMGKALYDRTEGLKGVWLPEVPGLCDKYFDFAEAALQALLESLPISITIQTIGQQPLPNINEEYYKQLLGMKK